jgi:3-phosphoshikimate 1-carboxyvinyltransferase
MPSETSLTAHEILQSGQHSGLTGRFDVPGDKSISHRSLILGGLAIGTTKVTGLLEGEDVMATGRAMQALGAGITRDEDGIWHVAGVGTSGLVAPESPLDLGNSGTGVRLLMGVVAGQPLTATFCGDASLSRRPMARVTDPLAAMGADITARDGDRLPVTIAGSQTPLAADHTSKVASAQIKSAVLLAALNARGTSIVREPTASRDHTEAMLRHFGATVRSRTDPDGTHIVELEGEATLTASDIIVPRDPSSAAFPMVAALITEGSDLTIPAVGMNPLRTGLIRTLREMGGDIEITGQRTEGGEDVADLRVRHSRLHGIDVPPARAASMIDEYPILAVAATQAEGVTRMLGVEELRVKETDRIAVVADGIAAAGGNVAYDDHSMTVTGGAISGGITIDSQHDHRIAMSFLTLGMVSAAPMTVSGCATINTSFPGFADSMNGCGAALRATGSS